jgi:hypothetical protein
MRRARCIEDRTVIGYSLASGAKGNSSGAARATQLSNPVRGTARPSVRKGFGVVHLGTSLVFADEPRTASFGLRISKSLVFDTRESRRSRM